jgi:energy-coupling factor transport system permease protein
MRDHLTGARLPRALHPVAWWVWALGLVVAVGRTTNPLLLILVLGVLAFVVAARRGDAPWARAFKYYLIMALVVIVIRMVFRAIFATGTAFGQHVLFTLPQLHPPHWYAGVHIGGPVTVEGMLAAAFDGLRLGTLLCCIGAANVLANPKRALRVLPGALYELGMAVVVALSVAPQLVESAQRVHRARKLRGGGKGLRGLRAVAIPVFEDALERSLRLAAGMDARGYGRTGTATRGSRRLTAALLLLGMLGLCAGAYGLLDAAAPRPLGLPTVALGALLCCLGLAAGSRRVRRTAYRPDPWLWPEWVVSGGGMCCAALMFASLGYRAADLNPLFTPLAWPALPLLPTAGILLAGLAALAAPQPPRRRAVVGSADTVAVAREEVPA